MPVILSVDELEPGMRLYHAIHRDDQVMLPAGTVLEEWEINALRRRLPDIQVSIGDPVLDEFADFEDDSRDAATAVSVNQRIGGLMKSVKQKLGAQTSLRAADIAGLQGTISAMIDFINNNPVTSAMLVKSGDWHGYLQEHSGNVFYVSLLIGNAIRDYVFRERKRISRAKDLAVRYGMDLTPLGLGCFFHDIGMVPVEHVYSQKEPLSEEDHQAILAHPIVGMEALPKNFDAVARMIVRTHHENYNGTGYPSGMPASKLHIFSRVIRVADAYDAATSSRVYRKGKSPARVLWEMSAGPHKDYYDPAVVKILVSMVQPFPIGARIRINTGQYAVVVRHNRKMPFRPVVIVAFDENGKKLKKSQLRPPINLAENDEVRLTEFGEHDLSFLNEGDEVDGAWGRPESFNDPKDETPDQLFSLVYP